VPESNSLSNSKHAQLGSGQESIEARESSVYAELGGSGVSRVIDVMVHCPA
jgi:hypothetical protein